MYKIVKEIVDYSVGINPIRQETISEENRYSSAIRKALAHALYHTFWIYDQTVIAIIDESTGEYCFVINNYKKLD